MKNGVFLVLTFLFSFNSFTNNAISKAQAGDSKPSERSKSDKNTQQQVQAFAVIDSLVNNRQFVFQAEYSQESYMIFVLVDSLFGEVQNGNRNNLQGRITEYEVRKNEKKKTIAVTVKMRGEIYTADVFLFIGSAGKGTATIRSEFPGNFSFSGQLVDFEHASIYEDPSHFIH
jgi:hypothetical protein